MNVNSKAFIGALRAAAMHASDDTTRPHLNAIRIEFTDRALRFVSTDGHRLFACEIAAEPETKRSTDDTAGIDLAVDVEGAALHVALADVGLVTKAAKSFLYTSVMICRGGARGMINAAIVRDPVVAAHATFPPYAQVIPAMDHETPAIPVRAVEIAAEYFGAASDAFAALAIGLAVGTKGTRACTGLRILHAGELDPIMIVSPKVPDAVVVIMPIRSGGAQAYSCSAPFLSRVRSAPPSMRLLGASEAAE